MSAVRGATPGGPPVRDDAGYYATPLGRFISVTTIISLGVPKPALFHWAAFEAAQCAVDNIPALVQARGAEARREMRAWIQHAAERKRDTAADLGTLIHALLEARILGQPTPPLTEEQTPWVEAFDRFLNDWQPKYEATELTVANPDHGYAGTLDAIAQIPALFGDEMVMADYKTGKNVYPEVGLQLSAYQRCPIGWTRPAGIEVTPPPSTAGAVIHIRPKHMPNGTIRGYSVRRVLTTDDVYEAFRAAQVIARHAIKDGLASKVLSAVIRPPKLEQVA